MKYWYLLLIFSFPVALVLNKNNRPRFKFKIFEKGLSIHYFHLSRRLLTDLCILLKMWLFKIYTYQYKLYLLQILLKPIVSLTFVTSWNKTVLESYGKCLESSDLQAISYLNLSNNCLIEIRSSFTWPTAILFIENVCLTIFKYTGTTYNTMFLLWMFCL